MHAHSNKEQLIKRIRETSYLEGDFLLRSGNRSKYYLDKYLFESYPDILNMLGEEFLQYITKHTTLIAGAELGGIALAVSASITTHNFLIKGIPWVIVRNNKKYYGTGKMIEGNIKPGDIVLLVEDIATTGGQILEAAKIICDAGAKVEQIVAVIDRMQGARENIEAAGFTFTSILTKQDLGIDD